MNHTLLNCWDYLIQAAPDKLAVIQDGKHWSRQELDNLARELQDSLDNEQLKNHGVVLQLPNGVHWLAQFIALRRTGAVVIPVDFNTASSKCHEYAQHLNCFALQSQGISFRPPKPRRWKQGLSLIKLTSGSSGTPKAIPFTESELRADSENIMATMGFGPDDLNYALLPFAHSYALGNLISPLLTQGVPMVIGSTALPRIITDEIRMSGATVFPSVPTIFESIVRTNDLSLGNLSLCISAAAPLSPTLAKHFHANFGLHLHNFYGASECGGIAYDRTGESGLSGASIGKAMIGVSLSQTNDGRLRVCSKAVSSYRKQTDSDGRSTVSLEDKVGFLPSGEVVIHGRTDRVVKCGGRRIDLNEVEQIAEKHQAVERAAAIYMEAQDRILVLYSNLSGEANASEEFGASNGRIRYKRIPVIPITLRGKVNYAKLINQYNV